MDPDETLVVTLTEATTSAGTVTVGTPATVTTTIEDPVVDSINRVTKSVLPGVARAISASTLGGVSSRMAQAAAGPPPAATADLSGLSRLYGVLQSNERALQDGSTRKEEEQAHQDCRCCSGSLHCFTTTVIRLLTVAVMRRLTVRLLCTIAEQIGLS